MLKKKLLYRLSIIIFICVVVGYWAKREMPIARTDFASFEEFCEVGARGYLNLPDCAEDVKYYLHHPVLYMHCIYSFSINDEAEYDAYMEELKDYSCIELGGSIPEWSWNNGYSYTEDELEEMEYLEKNYENMDYIVLYFRPIGIGTVGNGIVVNEKTHRFVMYYYGGIR